jgi:Haem-binding uptake, Tiki superfamily, ChaN
MRVLAEIEPEVRASDQTWRKKYLREYTQAFRSYESIIDSSELETQIASANMILVGDYHALPACQQFAAKLLKDCAKNKDRPVVLALEPIFSRDQHILDEWWRGEIREKELRRRIRFDLDWGYDWDPFYRLLLAARKHADAVFGLDCMPREDLRKIGIRDRHAAHKLVEIRKRHPRAAILALIGESHLAPTHLPALLGKHLPGENVISILQNVDALYWQASQEKENVLAVRVSDRTVCVFNSTPLEKYESYRLCLDRWRNEKHTAPDFAPAVYGLINSLLQFLDINRHSSHNGTQPKYLVDLLPEVYGPSIDQVRQFLSRQRVPKKETKAIFRQLADRGCLYLPQFNAFVTSEFRLTFAAEEAARFIHHACQGLHLHEKEAAALNNGDRLHAQMLEYALADLGSRILGRGTHGPGSGDLSLERSGQAPSSKEESGAHYRGYALGAGLYGAHLQGQLSRIDLKRLFLFSIKEPGKAGELCSQLRRRLRLDR